MQGTGSATIPGTFSERIGMSGMLGVVLITFVCVVGMIWLEIDGKPPSAQLAMIAGAGMGIIGAALKTSPDESKKPAGTTVNASPTESLTVNAPSPVTPQPPAQPGPGGGAQRSAEIQAAFDHDLER